jgi:hypothetical protein
LDCEQFKFTAEAQRAQSKTILDINELNQGSPGTAIEILGVKRGTIVFLPFKNLAHFASLRLETSF